MKNKIGFKLVGYAVEVDKVKNELENVYALLEESGTGVETPVEIGEFCCMLSEEGYEHIIPQVIHDARKAVEQSAREVAVELLLDNVRNNVHV